jgi:hypothetical protein
MLLDPRRRGRHAASLAAAAALLLLAGGCGDANAVKVYPVRGKVLYEGAPAAGATVIFVKKGQNGVAAQQPAGLVKEDGSFEVTTFKEGDGAPEGSYSVGICWRRDRDADGNPAKMSGGIYPDFLKDQYLATANPKFSAEVKPEDNELPTFDLKAPPANARQAPPPPKKLK